MANLPRCVFAVLLVAAAGSALAVGGDLALGIFDPDPAKADARYAVSLGNQVSNTLLALLGFWHASRMAAPARTAVRCLAGGLLGFSVGNWIWFMYNLQGVDVPYPSLADVGFLLLPLLAAFGLGLLLRILGRTRQGIDLAIGILFPLTVLVAFYAFVVQPHIAGAKGWRLVVDLAYPTLDALVLGLAGLLVFFSRPTPLTPGVRRVALAVGLLSVADVALIVTTDAGAYFTGGWVDALYVVASFVYGLSILSLDPRGDGSHEGVPRGSSA